MPAHGEYVERIPKAQATHCSEREKSWRWLGRGDGESTAPDWEMGLR